MYLCISLLFMHKKHKSVICYNYLSCKKSRYNIYLKCLDILYHLLASHVIVGDIREEFCIIVRCRPHVFE